MSAAFALGNGILCLGLSSHGVTLELILVFGVTDIGTVVIHPSVHLTHCAECFLYASYCSTCREYIIEQNRRKSLLSWSLHSSLGRQLTR